MLNVEISRSDKGVTLRQTAYIEKLASTWLPEGVPSTFQYNSAPHTEDIQAKVLDALSTTDPPNPDLLRKYQSLVGSLLYAATNTRPDIAYAVSMLCRAMARPTPDLLDLGLRIVCYLYRHRHIGLFYESGPSTLSGMSDADWAVKHSTSGMVFMMSKAAISWGSKKQTSVALSSCEAEIVAASEAGKEAVHMSRLATELKLHDGSPIDLHMDNRAGIDVAYNPEHHTRMKHVDRRHFYVRELVEQHRIRVPFVSTVNNIADFFTKPLPKKQFIAMRDRIMNSAPTHHSAAPVVSARGGVEDG